MRRVIGCAVAVGVLMVSGLTAASAQTSTTVSSKNLAPIKIGFISSDSGSTTGTNPDGKTTVDRWEKYWNARGGINGHKIQVIHRDDGGNPATAQQAFEDLKRQGVVFIADNSIVQTAFRDAADAANIPVIGLANGIASPLYGSDPNFFTSSPTLTPTTLWSYAKIASLVHAKKMGFIYCSELAVCANSSAAVAPFAKQMGIDPSFKTAAGGSDPNYTAPCLAAKEAKVDFLIIALLTGASRMINDCAAQGYFPTIALAGGSGPNFTKNPNLHNLMGTTPTLPYFVRNASTKTFHTVMDSYLPKSQSADNVITTWAGLELARRAAAKVSATPTSQDIYDGLYALTGSNVGGLTQTLNFVKGKPAVHPCGFVYELKNKKLITPAGTKPICPPANLKT